MLRFGHRSNEPPKTRSADTAARRASGRSPRSLHATCKAPVRCSECRIMLFTRLVKRTPFNTAIFHSQRKKKRRCMLVRVSPPGSLVISW